MYTLTKKLLRVGWIARKEQKHGGEESLPRHKSCRNKSGTSPISLSRGRRPQFCFLCLIVCLSIASICRGGQNFSEGPHCRICGPGSAKESSMTNVFIYPKKYYRVRPFSHPRDRQFDGARMGTSVTCMDSLVEKRVSCMEDFFTRGPRLMHTIASRMTNKHTHLLKYIF